MIGDEDIAAISWNYEDEVKQRARCGTGGECLMFGSSTNHPRNL